VPSCCTNCTEFAQKFVPTPAVSISVSKLLYDSLEIRANSASEICSMASSISVPFSVVRPYQKSVLYGPLLAVLSASNSVLSSCLGMCANTQQLSSFLQLDFSLSCSPKLMKKITQMKVPQSLSQPHEGR
jgi:hypothetical protein